MRNGIYRIKNKTNGKSYIGSAAAPYGLKGRWDRHQWHLDNNCHPNLLLQRAWVKYGADSFAFEVLLYCDPENCLMYEQITLDYYKPEYNICQQAGSRLGTKHSEETKQKLCIARRKRIITDETKRRIGVANSGRKISDEHKAKLSQAYRGEGSNSAKLTENNVKQIRSMIQAGYKYREIAAQFGVNLVTISDIKRRKSWKYV